MRDEIQETGSGGQGMGITETVEKEIPRWTAMSQAGKQPVKILESVLIEVGSFNLRLYFS